MYIDCKILYQRSLFISLRTVDDLDKTTATVICFTELPLHRFIRTFIRSINPRSDLLISFVKITLDYLVNIIDTSLCL